MVPRGGFEFKMIENHKGRAFMQQAQQAVVVKQ